MYTTEEILKYIGWDLHFSQELLLFIKTAKSKYNIDNWTTEQLSKIENSLSDLRREGLYSDIKNKVIDALVDEFYITGNPVLDINKVRINLLNKKFGKLFECPDISLDEFGYYGEPSDFDLLEIDPTPNLEKIKEGYRKVAKKYHPDLHPGTEEKFNQITEAYERLLVNK